MNKQYIFRNEAALPLTDLLDNANVPAMTWSPDVQAVWDRFFGGLVNVVEDTIPNCSVTIHDIDQLADAKEDLVKDESLPMVTLDSYDTYGNFPLQLSRHFNPKGELMGIGKRPGSPDLPKQLANLHNWAGGSDIVLFEDDIFTGSTAKTAMEMLEKHGIGVSQFIAGIQVAQSAADARITSAHQYDPNDVYELADPRDFLIGGHQAGLVYSVPYGVSRAPYIAPYVDITARASIPADRAVNFSRAVLSLNRQVFVSLEELASGQVMVNHGSKPFAEYVSREFGHLAMAYMTMLEFCDIAQGSL
ncbi:MAG TPA: hypothetical protein VM124_03575 [Candidatus Limnocylindrales bacterium]|nr:hypothetical protein [Candidatus Limnocylindrales bacterium]